MSHFAAMARGRAGRSMAAQAYSQIVTVIVQIAVIPLLVMAWGIETFGVWLLVWALPSYLALCDFGFTFVARNSMAIAASAGQKQKAVATFQSVLLLLLLVGAGGFALFTSLIWSLPIGAYFILGEVGEQTVRLAMTALVADVLVQQVLALLAAGLRADGRPASEAMFIATARGMQAVAICAAALAGADMALAAGAGLASRLALLTVLFVVLRVTVGWLPVGVVRAGASHLRELATPALSYMLVPVSHALLIHGPVLVLGTVAGPATVALFSITRTVTRIGTSAANMLSYTFMPEYSFAHGDDRTFHRIAMTHGVLLGVVLAVYLGAMALFSGWAITGLARTTLAPLGWLTGLLVLSASLEMVWSSLFAPMAAINRHRRLAVIFALGAATAFLLFWRFPTLARLCAALIAVHGAMVLFAALPLTRRDRQFGGSVRAGR